MKITIERTLLLKALKHVYRVVERRTTIPILSNVLIRADELGVHLRATDLDLEISEILTAQVVERGGLTVPAHMLHDLINKLPDGAQVALETEDDGARLLVRSGRSKFTLQALPEEEFPTLAVGEMPHTFQMDAAELKHILERTQFAMSSEETRYYLNGVYWHSMVIEDTTVLRAVATDGHRLARVEISAPEGAENIPGIILPRKAVAELLKLADDCAAPVRIEISTAKARFTFGDCILTTKLIDGSYPDYNRVIPVGNPHRMVVDCAEFSRAVDRVSTISSERGRSVKLMLQDGRLTLSVTNPDAGQAVEELEVDAETPVIEIGFNARYILDIMAQLESDTAVFLLNDPASPAVVQSREGANTLFVLMPMRV
jgi:DNA polymerase III subunit beta